MSLRITEIMYNPRQSREHEFIELTNFGNAPLSLAGVQFTSGIGYTFTEGTLGAGESLVLAAQPDTLEALHPELVVAGRYTGGLDNGGEKITLADAEGDTIVSVDYDDEGLWAIGPDGFGPSLVLADPDGHPDSPSSWRGSTEAGGSPGRGDPPPVHEGVVVNEILPHKGEPAEAAVEIANLLNGDIDIGGWYLSDNRVDLASLQKFRIPAGTVVPAGGRVVLRGSDFAADPASPTSLSLAREGGAVYLTAADQTGGVSGYIVAGEYGPLEADISVGRHSTSVGVDFTALARPTLGAPNSSPRVGPVVVNEIMYHPEDNESEFLELFNLTGSEIALYDDAAGRGWQVRGISAPGAGTFEFAAAWAVPAGGYLLLVPGDPDVFRSRLSVPADVPIAGPYSGRLGNEGDRIRLMRPVAGQGESVVYAAIDQLRYNDRAPWPRDADGDGPSLERIFASDYANDPANWDASSGRGTPGSENSVSGDDRGGLQRPSDLNQDGSLNITDAVGLLGHLFGGVALDPPCQGAVDAGGNVELLDASGDGRLNVTDAVYLLTYLFRTGPAPALGRDCVRITDCPDACAN